MTTKQERMKAAAKKRQAERAQAASAEAEKLPRPSDSLLHRNTIRFPPWETHGHLNAYFLAAVCIGISALAHYNNTMVDNERRLKDPVAAVATVVDAECQFLDGQYRTLLTYMYQGVGPDGTVVAENISDFVDQSNGLAQCEAGLSAVDRTPVTVWHERGDPANQRWTLEEEDHRPFLWGLVPGTALVLWGMRAQRRIKRAKHAMRSSG